MSLYENVDRRAARTLAALVRSFPIPLQSDGPFVYRTPGDAPGWQIRYVYAKKWLSRVYKLEVSCSFPCDGYPDVQLVWVPGKKHWRHKHGDGSLFAALLNQQRELNSKLASVDMEKVELVQKGGWLTITVVPLPGCFVWTLIPPMHYYVRLKQEEVETLTEIAQLLERSIQQLSTSEDDHALAT